MTGRRNYEPQKCIPVLNDLQEEKFPDETDDFDDDSHLDCSIFTKIWKTPERLSLNSDHSLLLGTLSREIREENYEKTLFLLKIMKKSLRSEYQINETVDNIYKFLLLQLLKDATVKKIDLHIIMKWLETGDRLFCNTMSKKSYAILKLYFLCRNRKSKMECFSCGCFQKYFIELYTEDNNTRLILALNSLIVSKLGDLDPTIKRIFTSLPEISSIEYFECYTELLSELQICSVITDTDEKNLQRIIQLFGILYELRQIDVPKACSGLNNLIGTSRSDKKKKSSAIENILRNKLLSKIYDSIMSSDSNITLVLTRNSVQNMAELVKNEKYSCAQQASILFSPLQLLNRIFSEFDVWEKSWPTMKNRLDGLDMGSSRASILFLYFISLIYRNEPSFVANLVDYLEQQYQKSTKISVKITILHILEVMEVLAASSQIFQAYIKENNPKSRLILDSELEIVLQYIQDFSSSEIHQFLQKRKFSNDEHSLLMEKLKNVEIPVNNDGFWKSLLEKIDENSMTFIRNQMRILVNRRDRKAIAQRIEQVTIKTMDCQEKKPKMEILLLNFPQIILDFSDSDFKSLPATTTISLVHTLIFGYAAIFEGNESRITTLFHRLLSKIDQVTHNSGQDLLEVMEVIAEKIRAKQISGTLEIGFLKGIYNMKPDDPIKKERIVQISSILFGKLAIDFQRLGDTNGNSPFCQLVTIIDEFMRKSEKAEVIPNYQIWRNICEKSMEGFAMGEEKWNWLFSWRKVLTVLNCSKRDNELLQRLMRILNKNETLLSKLREHKEFVQFENSLEL